MPFALSSTSATRISVELKTFLKPEKKSGLITHTPTKIKSEIKNNAVSVVFVFRSKDEMEGV